jgi:hypothetical protein
MLTPWEGGPAWRDHERWPHPVKADAAKDAYLALHGPIPPGEYSVRCLRCAARLALMVAARRRYPGRWRWPRRRRCH